MIEENFCPSRENGLNRASMWKIDDSRSPMTIELEYQKQARN